MQNFRMYAQFLLHYFFLFSNVIEQIGFKMKQVYVTYRCEPNEAVFLLVMTGQPKSRFASGAR